MDGAAAPLKRPRWIGPALLAGLVALLALGLVTWASYDEARRLVHHRGVRPSVTPADSGLTYETVPFAATDGTRLEGWWIVPKDGARRSDLATVILCHPEDDSFAIATGMSGKARVLPLAVALSRAGFLVLAFDFRSYGASSGAVTTGGDHERKDLHGAIAFAGARSLGAPLVLWGRGMGATVALLAGGGAGVEQVLADDPRSTWNDAVLGCAGAARSPLAWLAAARLVPRFVQREIGGEFEGDAPQLSPGLASTPDSAVVVLSRGPGARERDPAGYDERVVTAIESRLAGEAAEVAAEAAANSAAKDSVAFLGVNHGELPQPHPIDSGPDPMKRVSWPPKSH